MATSIVTIETPAKIVACNAEGKAEQVMNVKNTSGRALSVGLKLVADTPAQEDWLEVEGSAEQEMDKDVLSQIQVKIQVPPDCPPGRYSYRLLVFSTRSPGEEFTEGETVVFEVPESEPTPEPKPKPGCSWCIPAAIIAGVVLLGSLLTWFLWPDAEPKPEPKPQPVAMVTVPNLKGKGLDVVLPLITRVGLVFKAENLKRIPVTTRTDDVGKVLAQKPPSGTRVAKGTEILLSVGMSQTGIVITKPMAVKIQRVDPMVLKKFERLLPRSVEPAEE